MSSGIVEIEHHGVSLPGVWLHYAAAGPADGPLVVLLHGFPEPWFCWERQLPALAAAGFRVVAPDQRGYNLSDKPPGVRAYRLERLAADVGGLVTALGRRRAAVVGHDWGAAVTWALALSQPDWLERIGILNVPHPAVFLREVRRNPRQMLRSWYILFFQVPWLPEAAARRHDWAMVARALRGTSRPGTFGEADLQRYRAAWSRPGAYTAMVNWYRALVRYRPSLPADPRVRLPALMLWGARDRFLGREMAQPSIDLCDQGRLVFFEEATHWLQHEEPARVNDLLIDFLRAG